MAVAFQNVSFVFVPNFFIWKGKLLFFLKFNKKEKKKVSLSVGIFIFLFVA